PGRTAGLSAVEKLRAHEYGHEPLLYPRLEPARFTSGTVEGEQRLEIGFRDGPAECAARKLGQDLLRAGQLLLLALRITAENALAAACRLVDAGGIVGTDDLHTAQA